MELYLMEDKIQADIVKYLRSKRIFSHSVPNEGAGRGNAIRTSRLVTMGLFSGVGDLVVWWHTPQGTRVGYLEVKTPKGRQSERQEHFQEMCEEAGIPYRVVRSVPEVKAYMDEMGFIDGPRRT